MESWNLDHPQLGRITLERGYDAEFAATYPDWPETPDREIVDLRQPSLTDSFRTRLEVLRANPPARLQVSVNGKIVARQASVSSGRIPLTSPDSTMRIVYGVGDRSQPHLYVESNFFDDVLAVDFRQGSTVVEFDPPPGSRGAKRYEEMQSSSFKRVAYPLAAGLGKGGWALAVLILGPIVGRIIGRIVEWIMQYLPDISITPPEIYLPVPQLPVIYLPVPSLTLPALNLPDPPAWVLFVLAYSKIWIPVVVGIVLGVLGIRNRQKSEREKQQWKQTSGAPGET